MGGPMRHLAIALIMAQLAACLPDDSPPLAPADAFTSEDIAVLRTAMGRDPADSTWAGEYLADRLPDGASESDWTGVDTVGVPETALRDFGRRSRIAGPVPRRLADALGVPLVDA